MTLTGKISPAGEGLPTLSPQCLPHCFTVIVLFSVLSCCLVSLPSSHPPNSPGLLSIAPAYLAQVYLSPLSFFMFSANLF